MDGTAYALKNASIIQMFLFMFTTVGHPVNNHAKICRT